MGRKKKDESERFVDTRSVVITLKGRAEYRDWLAEVSRKSRIPAAVIVDLALAEWARKNGHPEPPER